MLNPIAAALAKIGADRRFYLHLEARAARRRALQPVHQPFDPNTPAGAELHIRGPFNVQLGNAALCGVADYWSPVTLRRSRATCPACIRISARLRHHKRMLRSMRKLRPELQRIRTESYAAWMNRSRERLHRRMATPSA